MDDLEKYVNAYYVASLDQDEEKREQLNKELKELIVLLLLLYGGRSLDALLKEFPDIPSNTTYSPSDIVVNQSVTDLQLVLDNFYKRIALELELVKKENPTLSDDKIINIVRVKNQYQVTRIIEGERSVQINRVERDIISQFSENEGYTITQTWVAVIDGKTCEVCRSMNGVTIPFKEDFTYSDAIININEHYFANANAHPNCRCRLKYNIERR